MPYIDLSISNNQILFGKEFSNNEYQKELNELYKLNINKEILIKLPIFTAINDDWALNRYYDSNYMIGNGIHEYKIPFKIDECKFNDHNDEYSESLYKIPLYYIICNASMHNLDQSERYYKHKFDNNNFTYLKNKPFEMCYSNIDHIITQEQLTQEYGLNNVNDFDIYYKIYENKYIYEYCNEQDADLFDIDCDDIECYYFLTYKNDEKANKILTKYNWLKL
jgi:hypothetical protein